MNEGDSIKKPNGMNTHCLLLFCVCVYFSFNVNKLCMFYCIEQMEQREKITQKTLRSDCFYGL